MITDWSAYSYHNRPLGMEQQCVVATE